MNKLFTKIVGAALGLTMAIGLGVAVGSNSEAVPVHAAGKDDWVQVTALSGLNTTDTYVIANDADKGYFMNGTVSSGHFQSTAFGASAPASATAAGAFKLEAVNASSNIYKIKLVSTSNYVTASKAGSGGGKVSDTSDSAGWKFLVSGTSFNAIYQTAYSGKYASLRCYNNTSWRTYQAGGQTSPASNGTVFRLYKYQSATLSSISVKTAPTKTSYVQGEYFDPTGLVITRTYSDSSTSDHTYAGHTSDFTFSPTTSTALTTSHTSVTITYGGKTCNQAITVSAPKTPGSLSSTGQTTSFEAGDTFTYGGTSTVTYTDSTSKSVTPSSFKIGNAGINPTSAGTVITPGTTVLNKDDHHGKTVYVLYTENATTVYTSYTISVAAVNKVTFTGGEDTGSADGQGQSDSLTKSGVTMACDSCYTKSGAYRFYSGSTLTISSTVGNIAQIEFNMNESYNSNLLSTSTGTYNSSVSTKGIWTGDAASIAFGLSAQARVNSIVITLASNDPTVELDATSATEVSMMRGDTNTSVKVLVKNIDSLTWNFTFDEDEDEGLTTSSYISVSASALISNVSTLTITTKAVGSTTMHISVSGTACETTVPVAVATKPASMAVVHGDISEGHLEIQTGTYKQVSFSGLDTDGNPYSIAAGDVTPSVQSGNSYVELSGSRITAKAEGTAVVRYTLKALTSIFAEVTVDVVDDYKTTVNSITFNSNLTATQGDPVDSSDVFATKVANTHFLSTKTIEDSELLFSYENNRSGAVGIGVFSYDFSHGTTVDSTHKSQAVYVFTSFDESYSDSFTITVEQKNDPLTAITLTNDEIENDEVDLARGSSLQLTWALTPTNPTDGRELQFSVDDSDEGVKVSVSDVGLISVAADSGLGAAGILVEAKHNTSIYVYLLVNVTLESMTYQVNEAESWTKVTNDSTLTAGDVIIVASDTKGKVLGDFTGSNKYANEGSATFSDGSASDVTGALEFKLETGSSSGKWKLKNGTKYLYGTSSKTTLCLSDTATDVTITISSGNATIDFGSSCRILHNVSSTRFSNYTSATSSTMLLPQIYLKSGGDVEMDVTETLFNGVHNNFGTGKTYEWDASCSNFDDEAWFNACDALMSISGYSNYKLNRAVGNMAGNEIEVFLAKYDAIIGKFGTTHDYLDRFAQGGINYGARIVNPINVLSNNGSTIAIIVVVSVISATAIGGYFFLRKRKED